MVRDELLGGGGLYIYKCILSLVWSIIPQKKEIKRRGKEMAAELNASLLNQHKEKHFTAGEIVRDIIIGVSDGLTVPFALAAGLSGANASSAVILTAGVAEIAAGAISMGLGGYLYYTFTLSLSLPPSLLHRHTSFEYISIVIELLVHTGINCVRVFFFWNLMKC